MSRAAILPVALLALLCACGGGGSSSSTSMAPSGSGNTTSHGTAECPVGTAIFTTSPLPLNNVIGWVPLGAMEPPGHTFPTDHQYLYFANPSSPGNATLNVIAPAAMRIWMIYQDTGGSNQYSLWVQPCAEIIARLGSITGLASALAAAAGAIDQNCQTFGSSTQCQKELAYDVQAGQVIGTINSSTEYALDWWLWDSRVSPNVFIDAAKFTTGPESGFAEADIVPASAYFNAAMTPAVAAKLGTFDGTQTRTTAPVDGTISIDVPGTARGYWFNPNQAYPPETYQAALAPDNITPAATEVISLGVSQANFSNGGRSGLRGSFAPLSSGFVNRAFEQVTADGNAYCYNPVIENTAGQIGLVILQLLDASTLKIEIQAIAGGSCMAGPWSFTGNAVTYRR